MEYKHTSDCSRKSSNPKRCIECNPEAKEQAIYARIIGAIEHTDLDTVKRLLISPDFYSNYKLLASAVICNKPDICQFLIEGGSDPETNALWYVITDKNRIISSQILDMLIPNTAKRSQYIQFGYNCCFSNRNIDMAKIFLKMGAKESFGNDLETLLIIKNR